MTPKKKKNKLKIYFAHANEKWGCKREAMIEKILIDRGFNVINPFKYEKAICDKYKTAKYLDNPSESFANEIADTCYRLVDESDEVFCWFPKGTPSIGTTMELDYAHVLGKKTTVLINIPHPLVIKKLRINDKLFLGYQSFVQGIEFKWGQ